ncbi:MAG TPA: hypothetical protein VE646_07770, partial [Actinomycetota bacterium]|nr:hypothetical protein [Actinomycetota bacterium]
YISAGIALGAGRPREALELYSTLDPHCPWAAEWVGPWNDWTAAFHLLDEHRRELKEARRARQWHPDRLEALFIELRALAALGRLDAVREDLARTAEMASERGWTPGTVMRRTAAELRVHGHAAAADQALEAALAWYEARPAEDRSRPAYRMAYYDALFMSGRLRQAEQLAAGFHPDRPGSPDLLGREGVLAARMGASGRAREIAALLEAVRGPYQRGSVDYWLAAIAAWSGEPEHALTLLRRALDQGRPRGIALHADPFVEPLWPVPAFQVAVAEDR